MIEVNGLTPSGLEIVGVLYDQNPATAGMQPVSSGQIDPVPETITHDLAVRDTLVYLLRMFEAHDLSVDSWTMESRRFIAAGETLLKQAPDIILVAGEERIPLFVEVDLGTESIDSAARNSWRGKFEGYARYLDDLAGNDPLFEGCSGPMVVVVCVSQRRLKNLEAALTSWGADRRWRYVLLSDISPLVYDGSASNSHGLADQFCLRAGL